MHKNHTSKSTPAHQSLPRHIVALFLSLALCFMALPPRHAHAAVDSWEANYEDGIYTLVITGDAYLDGSPTEMNQIITIGGLDAPKSQIKIVGQGNTGSNKLVNAHGDEITAADLTVSPDATTFVIEVPESYFGNADFTLAVSGDPHKRVIEKAGIPGVPTETAESNSTPSTTGSESATAPQTSGDKAAAKADDSGATKQDQDVSKSQDSKAASTRSNAAKAAKASSYDGITIDGNFDDWNAVAKSDIDDGKSWSTCDEVAMVWDGDYVYLYFMTQGEKNSWNDGYHGNWNSVTGAGPNGNGKFAITTDLGNQLLITLRSNGTTPYVEGVNGATAAANNTNWDGAPHMWEVAIPASELPEFSKTLSFGFYQMDPVITDVADLQGSTGGEFNGIVYDGQYDDWKYYPHTTIQYATSGTQESTKVDAKGALYSEDNTLYGHAVTTMPAHLGEKGGEFLSSAETIRINGDDSKVFYPRYIAVNENGTIDWNAPRQGLANGSYEYYIVPTSIGTNYTTIDELIAIDQVYGKITVTIADDKDECEFAIDNRILAKNLGMEPEDMKLIEMRWGRLGQQWVSTAGTSTGPIALGVLCAALAVGGYVANRRRKTAPSSEEA